MDTIKSLLIDVSHNTDIDSDVFGTRTTWLQITDHETGMRASYVLTESETKQLQEQLTTPSAPIKLEY